MDKKISFYFNINDFWGVVIFLYKIQNKIINRRNVKEGKNKLIIYKNPLLAHKNNFDKILEIKKEIKSEI